MSNLEELTGEQARKIIDNLVKAKPRTEQVIDAEESPEEEINLDEVDQAITNAETPLESNPPQPQKPVGKPTWCAKHRKPMAPLHNGQVGHMWGKEGKTLYCDGNGWHDYVHSEEAT